MTKRSLWRAVSAFSFWFSFSPIIFVSGGFRPLRVASIYLDRFSRYLFYIFFAYLRVCIRRIVNRFCARLRRSGVWFYIYLITNILECGNSGGRGAEGRNKSVTAVTLRHNLRAFGTDFQPNAQLREVRACKGAPQGIGN